MEHLVRGQYSDGNSNSSNDNNINNNNDNAPEIHGLQGGEGREGGGHGGAALLLELVAAEGAAPRGPATRRGGETR